VIWQQPLEVRAPLVLEISVLEDPGGWPRLEFSSRDPEGQRRVHAQARLGAAGTPPEQEQEQGRAALLARLQAGHPRRLEAAEIYARFSAIGIDYGPAHRALVSLALSPAGEAPGVLGELQLPAPPLPGLEAFGLHPSLLDGAFQATLGMALAAGEAPGTALPFALDRVEMYGPCTARMWVRVRPSPLQADRPAASGIRSLELELLDEQGGLRLRLGGFTTRPLATALNAAAPAAQVRGYLGDWTPVTEVPAPAPVFARHLLLAAGAGPERLAELAAALPGVEVEALAATPAPALTTAAAALLARLQDLAAAPRPEGSLLLQLVLEGEAEALAGLGGMLRTAQLEYPWLRPQLLRSPDSLGAAALGQARALAHLGELRHQAGSWLQPFWQPLWQACPAGEGTDLWRADGVYLLTGGAGGLGRLLVEDLQARLPGITLVLAGCSPLSGERAAWLAGLQARGARLSYRQVDLGDAAAVAGLVAGLRQQHGRLDGVCHGAGVLQDQRLADKDAATLARVLAPKVLGAQALDQALGQAPLDFFLLFSSVAGVFGNPGQADYATANAALDAFAEAREERRRQGRCQGRTLSIAWPLWREGGMGMDPAALELMQRSTGLGLLETRAGLDILARPPAQGSRLLVLAGDGERLERRVAALNQPPVLAPAQPRAPAPDGAISPVLVRRLEGELADAVSQLLKVDRADLETEVELSEYGFDSIGFTQLANAVNDRFGLEITPTLFFDCPTLAALARGLAERHGESIAARLGLELSPPAPLSAPIPAAPVAVPETAPPAAPAVLRRPLPPPPAAGPAGREPVAIIGLTGVFPQARDPEAFWENLAAGRDCISEIPPERWDWRAWWGDPAEGALRTRIKWGGFIDGLGEFDPAFFGLSGPEARAMDPQQRLLLTQSWRLLERAGYGPRSLSGSRTGVFIGTADTGYGRLSAAAGQGVEGYSMAALAPSLGPNRISYFYNFHGPSMAVETACSSALVAIHRAVQSLHAGDCDAAIAGGINTLLLPEAFVGFEKAGMLAPDGRCKPFSAAANGYARGEGVGLVLLKPLGAAERDGDHILGVILGSAENHGGHASSLTAPNPRAQAELIRQAWRQAGVDPRTAGYLEAHGTGTPLGDPIEVEALVSAFADLEREAESRWGPLPVQPCGLGSVKSNIGHLELAAGAAGLAKVLLQMAHGRLAATLHCDTLNPYLKLDGSRFQVVQQARDWPRPRDAQGQELPRRAGVSSFGFGGSNAHLVLQEYLPAGARPPLPAQAGPALILLSAKGQEQLRQAARELAAAVADEMPLEAVAWTLQVGRDALEHRLACTARDHGELRQRLLAFADGQAGEGLHQGQVKPHRDTLALLEGDEEMRRAVASLPARGKHDSLLQLWVRGLAVDWRQLYPERAGLVRLCLPGHPFARKTWWVETRPLPPDSPQVPAAPAVQAPQAPDAAQPALAPAPAQTGPVPAVAVSPLATAAGEPPEARALAALTAIAARVLEVEPQVLEPDTELGEYGFDSITMTGFASRTNEALGLSLTPADFFEFATLGRLARHVAGLPAFAAGTAGATGAVEAAGAVEATEAAAPVAAPEARPAPPPRPAAAAARPAEQRREIWRGAPEQGREQDPIAIVGVSCSFPMAPDLEHFWNNLEAGRDCISEIPPDRWDWRQVYGDPKREPNKTNIRWAGFMDGVFEFDPLFFGISPREAKLMDPQQRLVIEHVWKALEDAGHAPRSFAGQAVGLFVATSSSGYREMIGEDTGGEGYVATGAVPSVGPNRVSYLLDWHGPSEPVETACSSSLVALHRALQALENGDCSMAVVGGVNTIVTPEAHINFAKAGMLSPDGRCHTFSARANGYARGEGVGMIVLRRLSDAQRDGDSIYALVRGTAVNHGGRANSLTAPNTAAQAQVIQAAWTRAGVDPASAGYLEAHGTGTPLGDPVEINALKSAFRALGAPARGQCGIGAVKTNIGHLELAAGMAGIIKVLLQMRARRLVPSLHCQEINPYIDLDASPFFIVREGRPWPAPVDEDGRPQPRRAGVSSFGFGGVNAHVVLEAWEAPPAAELAATVPVLVPLSARDEARLRDQARQLAQALGAGRYGAGELADLAWTLQVGREPMKQRLALVVSSLEELQAGLEDWLAGRPGIALAGKAGNAQEEGDAADSSLAGLAARWVRGAPVTWPERHDGRRLHLPGYPFAREEYRIVPPGSLPPGRTGTAGQSGSAPVQAAAEPALVATADGAALWPLDPGHFYMRDHRVGGEPLLPGAMAVELARQAWELLDPGPQAPRPVSLGQVVWLQPVRGSRLPDALRLELDPAGQEEGRGFRLLGGSGVGAPLCVQGRVGARVPQQAVPALDLEALARRCPGALEPEQLYARYQALGLDYGPAFRVVADLALGQGEFLARLQLPEVAGVAGVAGGGFALHPVLLDGAFQACMGLFLEGAEEGQAALPFVLETLNFLHPTPARLWVHGRLAAGEGAVRRIDLDLADASGRVCVQVRGFSVRLQRSGAERGGKAPAGSRETAPSARDAGALQAGAEQFLAALVAEEAGLAPTAIDPEAALEAYGIDSIMINRLTDRLEQDFGPLPRTLFFDHQTLAALAGHFVSAHGERLAALVTPGSGVAPGASASVPAAALSMAAPGPAAGAEGIAIIGLAGRYPGADDLEVFWANLAAGRDCITEVPACRWDHSRYYDPVRGTPGRTNSKWGGFIDGCDGFDPLFFNMAPREAGYLDPQERLFLQCAWATLEDAGYTRASLARAEPPLAGASVGVFVGVMYEEYQLYGAERSLQGEPLALSGSAASIANRVSYFCNLHGPSLAVDSMCSSSLTAIHLACESLRAGSCELALAGGVNLTLHPNKYLALAQGRFTSSTGRCESFGQGRDGYVPGEGVGAVLLKPLAAAERDGDRILGVIRSSALNHGGKTNGYAVPNPQAQEAVIRRALARAGVAPAQIGYVEAHGTGTSLGDPIEIAALSRAYGDLEPGRCPIGSVKSNIGHGESAAGIAGLTKVLLQLRHGQLVPSLHSARLNPHIDFAATPFVVQQQLQPWPPGPGGAPRLAALSSFGAGGANAHLLIEEYRPAHPSAGAYPGAYPGVYPFSARDPERLGELLRRMLPALERLEEGELAAAARSLQLGREAFEVRAVVLAANREELLAGLAALQAAPSAAGQLQGQLPGPAGELARRWLTGAAVDWRTLWGGTLPPPLGLPSYPFAREPYWVPGLTPPGVREAEERGLLLCRPEWQAGVPSQVPVPECRRVLLLEPGSWAAEAAARLAPAQCRVLDLAHETPPRRYLAYAQTLLELLQEVLAGHPASALVQVVLPLAGDSALAEGLAGLLRTAVLEHPRLRCQLLALEPDSPDPLALILAEQAAADLQVRYQGGRRLVRGWQPLAAAPEAGPGPWRDQGVYLISGGAGGIGLQLAEHICARVRQPRLWLVGRSAPTPALQTRLAALPGQVGYLQADITDARACRRLVQEIEARSGALHGIVHAAGITRDKLLLRKDGAELAAVLAPKVDGLWQLDQASAACPLECFLLFASASGALGNPGQADYACANAWLDAFAGWRNREVAAGRRQGATLALDWPYWEAGGMRLEARQILAMTAASGAEPIRSAAAFRALDLAWAARAQGEQVLILAGQTGRLAALLGLAAPAGAAPAPASEPVLAAATARNSADLPDSAPGQPPEPGDEGLAARVLAWLTGHLAQVLGMAPEALAPEQALERYGVDSVLAMQLTERLEQDLGSLPRTLLFEHPSLALLTRALLASHGAALAALLPPQPPPGPAGGEAMPETGARVEAGPAPRIGPGDFPLSQGQQGLWRWQQLYPDSPVYNLPMAFELEDVRLPALEQACQALLAAWPLLACRILESGDESGGAVWQHQALAGPLLQRLSPAPGESLEQALARRARQPLDLEAGPPLRFELIQGEAAQVLLILVHHIVLDGLAAGLLSRHFWASYGALAAGRPLPPAPAGADFSAFVAWEQAYLESPAGAADRDYWQARLAGELPVLDLPGELHPPAGQPPQGASLARPLPGALLEQARDQAEALGIHLSAFFLGVLQCLLYRLTGAPELLLGMPVLGRPERRFEQSLGYFANLLLLRGRVRGEESAAAVLTRVHGEMGEALGHGAWPFARLAPALAQGGGRPPFQVLYSWQNFLPGDDLGALAGTPVRHLAWLRQEGDVPLALEFYGEGAGLRLVAVFDRSHFAAERVEALIDHYLALVAAVCDRPQAPVAELELLDQAASARLLQDWSGRLAPRPDPGPELLEAILARGRQDPDAPALVLEQDGEQEAVQLSYRELLQRTDALAATLLAWGVAPGQPVAVLLGRGPESLVTLLACLRMGAIWAPLDADYPEQRLALILTQLAPALVVSVAAHLGRLPVDELPVLLLDRPGSLEPAPAGMDWPELAPEAPAYLIHTSGSTGLPKGVLVSRVALASHSAAVIAHYGLEPADRVLQFAAHHVDAALEQILPTLAAGACLVLRGDAIWSPRELARVLSQQQISVADLPPAYLRDVLQAWQAEPVALPCPRLLIVGGEALTRELLQLWQSGPLAGARFLNAYGPTETTITATVHEVQAGAGETALSIGRPLPGGWIYILDRDGRPVPEGVRGELYIGGPRVALGYRGQPELEAERFLPDPWEPGGRVYRSGDLASFIPGSGGLIAFHGRGDHQVKIRGFRIELGEIEAVLGQAGVGEVAVLALPGADGDARLVAYVAGSPLDEAGLRRWVAERLPLAMAPADYLFLERLPLTSGGKLDRQALPPPGAGSALALVHDDPLEARLAEIWGRLLGRAQVAATDDFFLCGGHSLLVLRLMGEVRREFGRELSMGALLAAPTLGQQAALLRTPEPGGPLSPLLRLKEGGQRPPLFCIHPLGGGVGCYRALAGLLNGKRPVYGLQSPALGGAQPARTMAALAAPLLEALRQVQPRGPYHLAGWSMGGVLAFEMAAQLRAAGEEVAALVLIDSYPPALLARLGLLPELDEAGLRQELAQELDLKPDLKPGQDGGGQSSAPGALDPAELALLLDVFRAHREALAGYRPAPCPGPVTLLACAGASPEDARRGWGPLVQGALTVRELPGDHYGLLQPPQVARLAELLSTCLGDGSLFAK